MQHPHQAGILLLVAWDNRIEIEKSYADLDQDFVVDTTELRDKRKNFWDVRGRVWKTERNEVTTAGAEQDKLVFNRWFNARGLTIKNQGPNLTNPLFTKFAYDGAGRRTKSFTSYQSAAENYGDADDVVGDTVVEQTRTIYDAASNMVCQTVFKRKDNDTTSTGELAANNAYLDVSVMWYDKANRTTHFATYGRDNGSTRYVWSTGGTLIDADADGIPDEAENTPREPNGPPPGGSDDFIVTKSEYDSSGFQFKTTDNLLRVGRREYDREGRTTKTIDNYVDGVVGAGELDTDRTTEQVYGPGGRLSEQKAHNPKGGSVEVQTTKYLYEGAVSLNWPTSIIYPDSPDTGSSGTDQEKFTYDRLGRRLTFKDQRGVEHTYAYDTTIGRFVSDALTIVPSGVDGAVKRIEHAYDDFGRVQKVTSYDAASAGTVVNEVKYTFDAWRNITKSEQAHTGAVISGTPAVQYIYADGATLGIARFVRLDQLIYPQSRTVFVRYGSSGGVDDRLNRVRNLTENSQGTTKYTEYTYFGANSLVKLAYPQVTNGLNLELGSGGAFGGFDRYGRVIEQKWQNNAGSTIHDRYQYAYDRVSNRISRDVTPSTPPTNRDEYYVVDGLNRLRKFNRGTLSGGEITDAAAVFNQEWFELESHGNWRTFRWDPDGGANSWTTQSRTHNLANEIDTDNDDSNAAGNSISGTGADWVDPTYDKAGSMEAMPKPGSESTGADRKHLTTDGWNRLVEVKNDTGGNPGSTLVTYKYDGLHRRIRKLITGGDTFDYYYSEAWQVLEVRKTPSGGSQRNYEHYVWDLRYVDAIVNRFRNADNSSNGSLEERFYICQDANHNVTALVNSSGTIQERYAYEPYGSPLFFDASWGTRTNSSFAMDVLYGGYRRDSETGLYHVRNRYYHPTLGRWASRDPLGYQDGLNLYEYVTSMPTQFSDPSGLQQSAFTAESSAEGSAESKKCEDKELPNYPWMNRNLFRSGFHYYQGKKQKNKCEIEPIITDNKGNETKVPGWPPKKKENWVAPNREDAEFKVTATAAPGYTFDRFGDALVDGKGVPDVSPREAAANIKKLEEEKWGVTGRTAGQTGPVATARVFADKKWDDVPKDNTTGVTWTITVKIACFFQPPGADLHAEIKVTINK